MNQEEMTEYKRMLNMTNHVRPLMLTTGDIGVILSFFHINLQKMKNSTDDSAVFARGEMIRVATKITQQTTGFSDFREYMESVQQGLNAQSQD